MARSCDAPESRPRVAPQLSRKDARPRCAPVAVSGFMMSILVADDAPGVRKLLRLILGPGYEVIEAEDGDQALRLMTEHRPDVAILDVSMPKRTGIEVCRLLRQDPDLATTGVIVITANGTPQDQTAALD